MQAVKELLIPKTGGTDELPFVVHIALAVIVAFMVFALFAIPLLVNTSGAPKAPPKGWADNDYDAMRGNRESLWTYLETKKIPETTPITAFSIATANFGGIYTEGMSGRQPWLGSVSAEAARLQVEAGARAIVFDIWPDPSNPRMPVVASMVDTNEWGIQRWWKNYGLGNGVGRYSNWQMLSRNVGNVSEILKTTMDAAFASTPNIQNDDPFFLILNLHGPMSTSYLDYLGNVVQKAVGGHTLSAEWNRARNQDKFCQTAVSTFKSKVVIIVNPDIQSGYKSLPNVTNITSFNEVFLNSTTLGEMTNIITSQDRQVVFDPSSISTLTAVSQPNCDSTKTSKQTLPMTGFCVIQPSIGGQTTDNTELFRNDSDFTKCIGSGAQMVAVNLFSENTSDAVLTQWFTPEYFGKYSFKSLM